MSTTPTDEQQPGDAGPDGPRVSAPEARDLGRLVRTGSASPENRYIAGVAGGVARHFDVDPAIVRVAFVVLTFFGGAGLLLYGAGWLLIPDEVDGRAPISLDPRNRTIALYGAGVLAVLALLGDTVGGVNFPWPLAIAALVLLVLFGTRDKVKTPDWTMPRGAGGGPAQAGWVAPAAEPGTEHAAYAGAPAGTATPPSAPYAGPATPYLPPPPPVYVRTPDPRKRGPILFWFTLALIALLEGTLGIIDAAAGTDIPDPAYAAVAVGVTGLMLVLGAFWGRAGGLILVGLLSTIGLVASVAAHELDWEGDRIDVHPLSASELRSSYDFNAGELRIDLRDVSDVSALDGRSLFVEGNVGKIEILVPGELTVDARGSVGGPGAVEIFDSERGGIDTFLDGSRFAGDEAPVLYIDAQLDVGEIQVLDEDARPAWRDRIEERRNR